MEEGIMKRLINRSYIKRKARKLIHKQLWFLTRMFGLIAPEKISATYYKPWMAYTSCIIASYIYFVSLLWYLSVSDIRNKIHIGFSSVSFLAITRINDIIQISVILIIFSRRQKINHENQKLMVICQKLSVKSRFILKDSCYIGVIIFYTAFALSAIFDQKQAYDKRVPMVIIIQEYVLSYFFLGAKLMVFPIVESFMQRLRLALEMVNEGLLEKGPINLDIFFHSHCELRRRILAVNGIFGGVLSLTMVAILFDSTVMIMFIMGKFLHAELCAIALINNILYVFLFCVEATNLADQVKTTVLLNYTHFWTTSMPHMLIERYGGGDESHHNFRLRSRMYSRRLLPMKIKRTTFVRAEIMHFGNWWTTLIQPNEFSASLVWFAMLAFGEDNASQINNKLLVLAIVGKVVHKVKNILEEVNDRLNDRGTVYLEVFFDIHSQLLEHINYINEMFEEVLSMTVMSILVDVLITITVIQYVKAYVALSIILNVLVLTMFCMEAHSLTKQVSSSQVQMETNPIDLLLQHTTCSRTFKTSIMKESIVKRLNNRSYIKRKARKLIHKQLWFLTRMFGLIAPEKLSATYYKPWMVYTSCIIASYIYFISLLWYRSVADVRSKTHIGFSSISFLAITRVSDIIQISVILIIFIQRKKIYHENQKLMVICQKLSVKSQFILKDSCYIGVIIFYTAFALSSMFRLKYVYDKGVPMVIIIQEFVLGYFFLGAKLMVFPIVESFMQRLRFALEMVNERLLEKGPTNLDIFFHSHCQLRRRIIAVNGIFGRPLSLTMVSMLFDSIVLIISTLFHAELCAIALINNIFYVFLFCVEATNLADQDRLIVDRRYIASPPLFAVQRNEEMLKVWVQSDMLKRRDVLKVLSFINPRSLKSQGIVTGDLIVGLPYLAKLNLTPRIQFSLDEKRFLYGENIFCRPKQRASAQKHKGIDNVFLLKADFQSRKEMFQSEYYRIPLFKSLGKFQKHLPRNLPRNIFLHVPKVTVGNMLTDPGRRWRAATLFLVI
ncbi:hypothetical protein GQR58_006018 [Nymphon striatum]|nr:hypothetical protein GQR58_006018 [Nymphon striatum]